MKTLLHFRMIVMGILIFLFAENNLKAQMNWVKEATNPVMDNNSDTQAWDRYYFKPNVIVIDSLLSMWYAGTKAGTAPYQVGYAFSEDGGLTWTTNENPVIPEGDTGDWNKDKIPNTVLLDEYDTLRMWYSGSTDNYYTNSSIGYAKRHIDDIDWDLNDDPVLEPGSSDEWDDIGVWQCSVTFDGEEYHMWYHGWNEDDVALPGHMGHATSSDGEIWFKDPVNPVMHVGPSGFFYDTWVIPGPVRYNDGIFEMWFTGWNGNSTGPSQEIGYATSPNGMDWNIQNDSLPVLFTGATGDWDQDYVRCGSVVNHNGTLKMFFMGRKSGNGYQIGLATDTTVIGVGVNDLDQLSEFEIIISPNPTNDITTISYHLATASTTSIIIYNQQGQLISTLVDEKKQVGDHEIKFDSSEFPTGIYFCVLKSKDRVQTQKIIKM